MVASVAGSRLPRLLTILRPYYLANLHTFPAGAAVIEIGGWNGDAGRQRGWNGDLA